MKFGLLAALSLLAWPSLVWADQPLVLREVKLSGQVEIRTIDSTAAKRLQPNQQTGPLRTYRALLTPNDPQYALQWNLGVMNVPGAWDAGGATFFGSSSVVVAILDTGLAYTSAGGHVPAPDLAGAAIWSDPGEVAGDGLDNDGNGYIDDVNGWNFISSSNVPADDHGHGTHLAELIAAGTNNNQAAAGIAPAVTLMPLKVLDQDGDGTTTTIAAAIEYAVASGADIINLSLGGTAPDPVLEASITNAVSQGVLVVAAAGNDGATVLNYPARYTNTLSVGGTQYDGTKASYANSGPELDLAAPGGNVFVDQNGDSQPDGILQETCVPGSSCATFGLYYYSGTSQAAAQVSAVAALVLSCPSFTGNVGDILKSTATDLGVAGRDDLTGAGLVNAQAALAAVGCSSGSPLAPGNLTVKARSTTATLTSGWAYPYTKPYFSWAGVAGATYRLTWGKLGTSGTTTTQSDTSFRPTIKSSGLYSLRVVTVDGQSRESAAAVVLYRFRPAQLLVSGTQAVTVLSNKGVRVRSLSVNSGANAPFVTAGTVSTSGEDRYVIGGSGKSSFFRTSGQATSTLRPFGSTSRHQLSVAVLRRSGLASLYAVGLAQGSEVRVIDSKGVTIKRLILGSGKVRGLAVAAGDLDADGTDELVIADRQASAIRLYRANGQLIKTITPLGKNFRGGWSVAVGDVSADGRADVVAVPGDSRRSPPIYVLDDRGQVTRVSRLSGLTSELPFQVTTADLDGNGRDEVIAFAPGKKQLTVWTERGTRIGIMALNGDATERRIGRLP